MIHTVGPVWEGGDASEDELLARSCQRSLALAQEHDVRSIAFPSISTGVYEFPVERAAQLPFVRSLTSSMVSPRARSNE